MKKVLSVLLTAALLLSAFTALSMTSFAVDADTAETGAVSIKSVAVTGVDYPKPNSMPSYGASVPTGKGYRVNATTSGTTLYNGVTWYNVSDKITMNSSDRFVSGKQYKVIIYLQVTNDGYVFASSGFTAAINEHNATIEGLFTDSVCLSYTYTCRSTTIVSSVSVNVTAPVAGQVPSYVCSIPSDMGYSINDVNDDLYQNGVHWCRISDDTSYSIDPSSPFVEGTQYMVTVLLKPTDEYCVFTQNVTGTVNGNAASVQKSYANTDNRYIEYTFTCQPDSSTATVYGTAISFLDENDEVTIRLTRMFSPGSYSTKVTGNYTAFTIPNVKKETYIYSFSKKNHVTRYGFYTVGTIGPLIEKICPIGDTDNDGAVTSTDAMLAYRSSMGKVELSDYQTSCADVDGDEAVTSTDAMLIYRHAMGKYSLFS